MSSAKREAERLEKAELVEDWGGPVCVGDRFFRDVDDAADSLECDGVEFPEFVHTCTTHYYAVDAEAILQDMIENAGVDIEEYGEPTLHGQAEFVAACEAFNAANGPGKGDPYWNCDCKHKARMPKPEIEGEDAGSS